MTLTISVLASGSSGNSIYISDSKTSILIDAGLSGKELERRLDKVSVKADEIDAILVTHEHKDHIKGVGILSRRYNIPIFANQLTWDAASDDLGQLDENNCNVFSGEFMIGGIGIKPFAISHDAGDPVGYVVFSGHKKIGIATDTGFITTEIRENLKNLNFLVIESNHDLEMLMNGNYPHFLKKRIRGEKGHLSNDDTAALLPELINSNRPGILLAHLSKDNNIPKLAYITVKNNLEKMGFKVGEDLKLDYTYRHKPTKIYNI